jgi:hypothetical protein
MFKRIFTRNFHDIPLFHATIDLHKFEETGKPMSCKLSVNPTLKYDEHIKKTLNDLVDYIRDNYDPHYL